MKTEIEKKLNELAQEAFKSHSFNFFPLFPNILVRVFDFEEATTGLIIKPQTAQAPNHRAIVIRTWHKKLLYPDPYNKAHAYVLESELQEGDIVTIPFYAGVPTGVEDIDDAGYRVIPENKLRDSVTGKVLSEGARQDLMHIFFKQEMYNKRAVVRALIELVHHNVEFLPIDGQEDNAEDDIRITTDKILADYAIVPKKFSRAQS